jgi:hypothetical protein
MTVSLAYTVAKVLELALSKIGVKYNETEAQNIEDAHINLNLMLGEWSADPDLAVQRIWPVAGYTELSDTVDLPPEFVNAIVLNLAVALGPDYDQPADKILLGTATAAKEAIKIYNIRRIGGRIPSNGSIV